MLFTYPSVTTNPYYGIRQETSFIRLLHASPNTPPVDVYANNRPVAMGLAYRSFTQYLQVPAGSYHVRVFLAGQTVNPVLETNVDVPPGSIFTMSATGLLPNIVLLPIQEPVMNIPSGKLLIRTVHLSPDAPAIDITLPDGKILFANVAYKGITSYIPVNPGNYTLQARVAGTNRVVLIVPNIILTAGKIYTVYVIGLASGTPGLQVLIPLDGNSYLKV